MLEVEGYISKLNKWPKIIVAKLLGVVEDDRMQFMNKLNWRLRK